MKRHVLIYGLVGGILIAVLKWTEYRFLVIEHSIEIYGGPTAAIFAVLDIWLGLKLTGTKERVVVKEVLVPGEPFVPDERKQLDLGIRRREFEILKLTSGRLVKVHFKRRLFGFLGGGVLLGIRDKSSETGIVAQCF
jgi:NarL family two-component system response regulator LiaR